MQNDILLTKMQTETETAAVLCVEDLKQLLCIGRNTAYELVRSGAIRSIKIGRQYRIPLEAFAEYLAKE